MLKSNFSFQIFNIFIYNICTLHLLYKKDCILNLTSEVILSNTCFDEKQIKFDIRKEISASKSFDFFFFISYVIIIFTFNLGFT